MNARKISPALFLAAGVLACDSTTAPAPIAPSFEAQHPTAARAASNNNYAHILMTCNSMVGAYEVEPAAAAEVLPAQYTLALHQSANGSQKGLVYLQTSKCEGTGNEEDIGPFDLADAWLVIEGAPEVIDVPGAVFTLPTMYVYVLKAQTTSAWIKENTAGIYFQKEMVQALNISGATAPRSGNLVEMNGRGYAWAEFVPCFPPANAYGECWLLPPPDPMIPVGYGLAALPVGYNIKGFINQGNGKVATKEMACVLDLFGQGLIKLDIDPRSHMMEAGVFASSQTGFSFDAVAHCDLLIKPL